MMHGQKNPKLNELMLYG